MNDQPLPFTSAAMPRRWLVTMSDGSERVVEAAACRVERGNLIFSEAASLSLALAAGTWASVEQVQP